MMLTKIAVAEYMSKRLITLSKETNVIDAIKKLLDNKITCAPVIDLQDHLIGMFSEKDGMRKVGDFMTSEIISVDSESSIVDLAEKFQKSSVRSFPVFEETKLVGIISRTDVLRALVSIK